MCAYAMNDRLLNICFYRYSLLNRGGDRMVVEYANDLVKHGHRVTLYVAVLDTVLAINPAISIKKVASNCKSVFIFNGLLRFLGHDLVIVDIIHLPLFLSLRNRVLYFAQADDVEYYGNGVMRWIMDKLYHWYFLGGGVSVTVSEHLTRAFRERYSAKVLYTVANGIDLDNFYPEPEGELLALKANRKAVFFLARGDHYRKGYDLAIEAFTQLSHNSLGLCELWVCGDYFDGTGYSFPVRNFGVVSDTRLRQLLSSADIIYYPSRHEGFGLFPLEAMACGCAVVTTQAVPYAKEHDCIASTEIGDVPGMVDELVRLVENETLLSERKAKGINLAKSFDLKQSKIEFRETIQTLVTRSE